MSLSTEIEWASECNECTPENPGCPWNNCHADIPKEKNKENKMSEMIEIFKVVKVNEDGKLVSASVGKAIVEYEPGIKAEPRMWAGPLTGFKDIYHAIGFIGSLAEADRPKMKVFKAKAETTKMKMVWRSEDGVLTGKDVSQLPYGTILAKNITLTEEVWPK